jgi:hypothetical protein
MSLFTITTIDVPIAGSYVIDVLKPGSSPV